MKGTMQERRRDAHLCASVRDDDLPVPNGVKHKRSMHRAYCLTTAIVDYLGTRGLKGKYFFILDGNGENRRAIENALDDLEISVSDRPTVITLELDPNVAFANALRFGREHVRLTSADFRMQVKKNDVCGIERAILLEGHSVLSAEEKDNCIGLYLDYCGSPSKLTSFEKVYARLPQLVACAITVAKRQPNHAFGCSKRRKLAAPSTDHFEVLHTFDHDKVLCDMYIRKDGSKACDTTFDAKEKPVTTTEPKKPVMHTIEAMGWWRFAGAAAATLSIALSTAALRIALRICLLPLPGWRACLEDLFSVSVLTMIPSLLLLVLIYWSFLGARGRSKNAASVHAAALLGCLLLPLRASTEEGDAAGCTACAFFLIWVVLRSQFGHAPPQFPAIEGRTRYFRMKGRLMVALMDTLRTTILASFALITTRALVWLASALLGSQYLESGGLAGLIDLKPLIRPTMLQGCWLIHCALHVTEVVATERFRYCRASDGREVVLGMDVLIDRMGSGQGKRKRGKAIEKELAFLDACLLAEKSKHWRRALFTYNKGEYWYGLTSVIYNELTMLERELIEASAKDTRAKSKGTKPVTRSSLAKEMSQQRAFLTSKNAESIAASIRDKQVVFTWSVRTIMALAKACTKEDPLGVSQRHSKKPSLQDIMVTTVSLYMLFTSLEVQLAQVSGKQSGMVSAFNKAAHRVLGVNALDGDMETIYTNVWAMTDALKLALYAIVKAFTSDLYSLQMENIANTLLRASENSSALRDDPFTEKLPLFYPLWLDESQFGHGTPSQHAHILNQILLHNL